MSCPYSRSRIRMAVATGDVDAVLKLAADLQSAVRAQVLAEAHADIAEADAAFQNNLIRLNLKLIDQALTVAINGTLKEVASAHRELTERHAELRRLLEDGGVL